MKHIAKGQGVSQGKVRGKVKIINSMNDHDKFNENDILVTHLTDPTMVILMNKSAGIICNIGGLTSHPSIVSREMGIPCIVSAKCIETGKPTTEILKDEDLIEMCGTSGNIHKIEDEKKEEREE
ncbi:hypothetical protein HN695_06005 [Candidatus Woesearchaeota archaeon]|jgi:pyruvate, water dikinase|nr:hypothetical protein [Candidatus Woesearchaeota archaeon]MBT5272672.1 hypothetical protein [Candidatus Woesearchaeota archaeon]MBT6041279.1 hypothetical protein [Candidatus Woesearchaeota archaeon]MBT6337083.1 hypothetical protein [Candidatus Woesearchaeota archaeon]MBT7927863.1 hypothetical protein [Candidatus Woesearchaeota archaeon]